MKVSCTRKCIPGYVGFAAATGHEVEAVQVDFTLHLAVLHPICLSMTMAHLQPANETQSAVALVMQLDPQLHNNWSHTWWLV